VSGSPPAGAGRRAMAGAAIALRIDFISHLIVTACFGSIAAARYRSENPATNQAGESRTHNLQNEG
jgi:hypothetical protein